MLNELLVAERGLSQAGIGLVPRHSDIQTAARGAKTLHVFLSGAGDVEGVAPIPGGVQLWTLRNHNKNSFPFVQPKTLLDDQAVKKWSEWEEAHPRPKPTEVRTELLALAESAGVRRELLGEWATQGVMRALRGRLTQMESLEQTEAAALPAALAAYLRACDSSEGGEPIEFLDAIRMQLIEGLKTSAVDTWLQCSVALLVAGAGALWIDAEGNWPRSLLDEAVLEPVNAALTSVENSTGEPAQCALTGQPARLVRDTFPRVDLPIVGPTILFSRFDQNLANERYGRFGSDTMPVSEDFSRRLAAAARFLTAPERKGITWRGVPGEAPNQQDLLLAFVETVIDAPAVGLLVEEEEEDASEEAEDVVSVSARSTAAFEKRTERLVEAVLAKVGADFRRTPVRVALFRRLDRANKKVVYAAAPSVGDLYDAAKAWVSGERNVPPWLTLPVIPKGDRRPVPTPPLHVAPLSLIGFSKQIFIRGGTERQEAVGLPAAEALGLFLESATAQHNPARLRTRRILRLVLGRRGALVAGTTHALRRGFRIEKGFDREALRTITVLGVLLYKLDRTKEVYMKETAFRLGQLLAAVDVVHAGYCADVRGGDMPPSLLGNQVFSMAQANPVKALAMLCRRWKPYDGWAKRAARERDRATALVESKREDEHQRGWDIRTALRHAREMRPLADDLGKSLADCTVDDSFRAELLLGYIAGLPKAQKEAGDESLDTASSEEREV